MSSVTSPMVEFDENTKPTGWHVMGTNSFGGPFTFATFETHADAQGYVAMAADRGLVMFIVPGSMPAPYRIAQAFTEWRAQLKAALVQIEKR